MTEIAKNIYTGSEQSFNSMRDYSDWAILHCCKHPFHCSFVGYKGNLNPNHPDYALKQKNNEMALNLVDMDSFNSSYLSFNENMFRTAFNFLDNYYNKGCKILIHCNQGESRGPTLAMFYSAYKGLFGNENFDETEKKFRALYPNYNPKKNIYYTVQNLWNKFIGDQNK